MSLLGLLVALILFGVVYWAATRLLAAFGVGDPLRTVVVVLIVVIGLLWLLGQLTGIGPTIRLS